MRIISLTLLASLIGASGAPVFAADLAVDMDEVPVVEAVTGPGFDWSGLTIGAHAGEVFHGLEYYDDFASDPGQDFNWQQRGGTVGVSVGYDTALTSRIIAGAELRYDYFNTAHAPYSDPVCCELATVDDALSLTGRLGYLVTPDTLVYLRAGIASVGLSVPVGIFEPFPIQTGRATGGLIGIGAESRLSDILSATVEARYFEATSTFLTDDEMELYPKFFSVTAGLKYHFGDTGSGATTEALDAVAYDFAGAYFSIAGVGAASGMHRPENTPGAEDGAFWDDALGVGIGLGFDADIGGDWRLGAELTADYLGLVYVDPDQNSPDVGADTRFATVDGIIALTARLGMMINPSTLLYAKAGVAGLYTTADAEFWAADGGGEEMLPGYQLGLGIETAIADNITLGVEGTYTAATESLVTDNIQYDQVALRPEVLAGKVSLKFHF